MRIKNRFLAGLILAICVFIAPPTLTGCKSADRAAYVAVGTVGTTADAAIGAYNEYRRTHDVPTEQVLKVRDVVLVYTKAIEAARAAKNAQAAAVAAEDPESLKLANAQVEVALRAIEGSSAHVVDLINSIIPLTHK